MSEISILPASPIQLIVTCLLCVLSITITVDLEKQTEHLL